jgi:hypothetical protein
LKSTKRYSLLRPQLVIARLVIRPCAFRPPVLAIRSTSLRSGPRLVTSFL